MPRLLLQARHVAHLKPVDGKRTDYRDTLVTGLVLRVSPTSRVWALRMQEGKGQARRLRTVRIGPVSDHLGLAEARDRAREILTAGAPRPADSLTVASLGAKCLAALPLTPKTRREWERLLREEITPGLGDVPAPQLERAAVREWLRAIGRGKRSWWRPKPKKKHQQASKWTADAALRVLSRIYTWAAYDEELLRSNPIERLKLPTELSDLPASDRVLSTDELRRLLGALARLRDAWVYSDATLLLLLTGVRREGVLGLRREELQGLDGDAPLWVIPRERMKARREHVVPLSRQAVTVVRRRLAAVEPLQLQHLFPAGGNLSGEDVSMTWPSGWVAELREEMRAVEVDARGRIVGPGPVDERWTIHGLRRAMATHLREDLKVDRGVVRLLLAHRPTDVTDVYDRAELLPERRAALERWGEWLERLREPPAAGRLLKYQRKRR